MPMTREDYEKLLGELNNPELEHAKRTDILQELRNDYTSVLTDFEDFTKKTKDLQKDNDDLVLANSKLFRSSGVINDPDLEETVKDKEFSETVTLEMLEKQGGK